MISDLVIIAKNAGEAIMKVYREDFDVFSKDDDTPVTRADMDAHHIIAEALHRQFPDIPVISEEEDIPGFDERKKWDSFWLVDPLDGTKEFIKRNGEFTVNIALIEKGVPVSGVVYIPATGITYTGDKKEGSFRMDEKGKTTRIYSDIPDLSAPVSVAVSRSHGSGDLEKRLAARSITIGKEVTAGSSLKFCLVAEGIVDIYPRFGPTMEWDTAAGDAVFRYSGRTAPRKSTLVYNKETLKNEEFIIGI